MDPGGEATWLRDPVGNWSSWLVYRGAAYNHPSFRGVVVIHPWFLFHDAVKAAASGITDRGSLIYPLVYAVELMEWPATQYATCTYSSARFPRPSHYVLFVYLY